MKDDDKKNEEAEDVAEDVHKEGSAGIIPDIHMARTMIKYEGEKDKAA